ncbi:TBC1 domain family member 30 isoform X2 [Thalassophryne amazonica]|uniref:TBC1 domain family member 30 isoform X2 n=1 Tax=Thalassophryne amazonica TaxID=390379 RepID=UPI0014718F54|nr:TBC1 domain family member 30 isoform X2 [Thalassophryne amazonica]
MATAVRLRGKELGEVDICDGAVFVHSDEFSGFQQWTSPSEQLRGDTSSPAGSSTAARRSGRAEWPGDDVTGGRASIVDCLLVELYETYSGGSRRNLDSWDSSTEASGSDAFLGRSNSGSSFLQELQEKHTRRLQVNYLAQKAPEELRSIIQEVRYRTALQSAKLIRHLKRRDRLCHKLQKNYDIITACLQAVSQKRRVDTRLKFTIEPSLGKNGFQQWYDALKAVARLPTGIPKEWRKRVWLTLADHYLHSISIDWEKTLRFAFNERSNPDDDSLGIQIVKDLHRTGCSSYCGQEGEQDRVVLKRVLLAYARWNKTVGYCQGFNVLAALILEVTEGSESDALKVMIYLIDKVLPESYFANNLRALSVDMAVFRDLLRLKLPRLSQHLHHLQKAANREAGGSYEPPLINVFTMQWFLTMFATCLPAPTVLKIWDSVFFEGSEVLFRVGLAIWERLGERIEYCQTADEFYSTMGCLTQEMLEHSLIDPADLMQEVYSMAVFPFPQLAELREKYTYNITPFPTSIKSNGSGIGSWESDDDAEMDDEDSFVTALGCLGPLGGLLAPELQRYQKHLKDQRGEQGNIAELSPGAVGAVGSAKAEHQAAINSMMMERMSTDISALKKQYARIKRRQQQQAMQLYIHTDKCPATRVLASQLNPSNTVINHLLLGRKPRGAPATSRPTFASPSSLSGARAAAFPHAQGSPARQCTGSVSSNTGPPRSSGGSAGSPWRAYVRVHCQNVARARAQLGFGGPEGAEEEEGSVIMKTGEEAEEKKEGENQNRGRSDASLSRGSSLTGSASEEPSPEEEDEAMKRLGSLDLDAESGLTSSNSSASSPPAHRVPLLLPPPPSSHRNQESNTSGSETNSASDGLCPITAPSSCHSCIMSPSQSTTSPSPLPSSVSPSSSPTPPSSSAPESTSCLQTSGSANDALTLSLPSSSALHILSSPSVPSLSSSCSKSCLASSQSTPVSLSCSSPQQQQLFSPFPCIKQPKKSAAARNLGLYGPTSRTPTVHFPQLSRSLHRSGAAATGRR